MRESKRLGDGERRGRGESNLSPFQLKPFEILRRDHTKMKTPNLVLAAHTAVGSPTLVHTGAALRKEWVKKEERMD